MLLTIQERRDRERRDDRYRHNERRNYRAHNNEENNYRRRYSNDSYRRDERSKEEERDGNNRRKRSREEDEENQEKREDDRDTKRHRELIEERTEKFKIASNGLQAEEMTFTVEHKDLQLMAIAKAERMSQAGFCSEESVTNLWSQKNR